MFCVGVHTSFSISGFVNKPQLFLIIFPLYENKAKLEATVHIKRIWVIIINHYCINLYISCQIYKIMLFSPHQ